VPFKSKKQKTYLAINEPEVYKKFRKEENMYKVKKRAKGGKVDNSGQKFVASLYKTILSPITQGLNLLGNINLQKLKRKK
jgi:hypothetical protein